jgi:high-affinity Fe2+/Pb2+ permease
MRVIAPARSVHVVIVLCGNEETVILVVVIVVVVVVVIVIIIIMVNTVTNQPSRYKVITDIILYLLCF